MLSAATKNSAIRQKNSRGFTLIEILVVVVIISIMTALAVVRFSGIGSGRAIRRAIGDWKSLLPAVQTRAILQPAILGIKLEGTSFLIVQLDKSKTGDNKGSLAWEPIKQGHLAGNHSFPRGITIKIAAGNKISDTQNILQFGAKPTKDKTKDDSSSSKSTSQLIISKKNQPQIIFLPNGDVTPTKITVKGAKGIKPILLTITAGGEIWSKGSKKNMKPKEKKK